MVSLKALRGRIRSIKATQKITKSMQLISASRLNQMKNKIDAALPYFEKIREVVGKVLAGTNTKFSEYPWAYNLRLLDGGSASNLLFDGALIVLLTADRGLCGQFNSYLIRVAKQEIATLDKNVTLLCIGKRGYDAFKNYKGINVIPYTINVPSIKTLNFATACECVSHPIFDIIAAQNFSTCKLIYTQFISALKYFPTTLQLAPITDDIMAFHSRIEAHPLPIKESLPTIEHSYEPEAEVLFASLVKHYWFIVIYHALLNNMLSEHASRTFAMDNATRNSNEILRDVTIEYNRTRQASITRELIEIISGTEVLKE
ncbi:ATP synthase gamma chain [Alphaproteobacteria bacterium]